MTGDDLVAQLGALGKVLLPLARVGGLEDYALAASERLVRSHIEQAIASGVAQSSILKAAAPLLQTLIHVAEITDLPLSSESEALILQCKTAGLRFLERAPRKPGRPLAAAPNGPPEFSVFVDESGSASFDEEKQPVLCLAGVIIRDDAIPAFERKAERLLEKHDLPKELEFHTQEFLSLKPDGPLARLTAAVRYGLLREFLTLGMDTAAGVHQMPMHKALVMPPRRRKMAALGLDAYSQTVLWFVLTLDRACLLVMPGRYKYFYDRTDAQRKNIGRVFRALGATPNKKLQLIGLKGPPVELESHESRLIQLADVTAYYLNRHRQIEVKSVPHRQELDKHEPKILEMYRLIRPKIVDYISKDLYRTIDWDALLDFSPKAQKPQWRPPLRRGRRRR